MIRLSSTAAAQTAIAQARDVDALAYTLRRGPVLDALEAAAQRRGTHVRVRLEGAPFGDPDGALARHNAHVADELARCGADARLVHAGSDGAADAPLHAKALVVDGRLFLDDRNWGAGDFVVCDDDPDALRSVLGAFDGSVRHDTRGAAFAIEKRDALAREAELLDGARSDDDVVVESENFGYGPVYSALDRLAKSGVAPRLLVTKRETSNPREASALARLERDGVCVRVTSATEKFALVGGRAWIGSANASPAFGDPDTIDWGVCTAERETVAAARGRVEERWSGAKPFVRA